MCSICNIKNYKSDENMSNVLIMPLGISEEIKICYDVMCKKYFISTGNPRSNFTIYNCPTCGKKLS